MIAQNWLEQLCLMIPNVQAAVVVEHLDKSVNGQTIALWPHKSINCEPLFNSLPLLKAQVSPVVTMGKQVVAEQETTKASIDTLIIAYPLCFSTGFSGAVILEVVAKINQQAVLLQMLKWGGSWLQLLLNHGKTTTVQSDVGQHHTLNAADEVSNSAQAVHVSLNYLTIVQAVLSCSDSQQANITLVNEISRCWLFDRVSLGIVSAHKIEVKALSNSAHFDPRSNLIVNVQQAMSEVKNKPEGVYFTCAEMPDLTGYSGHQSLLTGYEHNVVLSLPLQENAQTVAVLLCEFQGKVDKKSHSSSQGSSSQNTDSKLLASKCLAELTILAGLLGPLMVLHQRSNQSISEHIVNRSGARLTALHQGRFGKFPLVAGVVFLLLMTCVIDSDFRVATEATLEGRIQRAVVAPFDGYVESAFARAGEQVEKGDILAQLDDLPLQLEKRGWLSKKEEYQKQYRQELATLSHAKARIIKAQIAQADVHIEQSDSRLQRAKLVSPLSGIIIEGDLSRSLGAPVEQGQVLFEVAPLDDYRVVLKVHERDIAYLQKGQIGSLMLTAYPHHSIPLTIQQVAIVYQQEGHYTWYRTEASLAYEHLPSDMLLRPGMEGVGKIEVGQKSLAWIGLHRLTDWLRLWLWSWTP